MFRLLVVLSELPSILGTIGIILGILGGRTPLLLLAASAVEATELFLWGRPLIPEKLSRIGFIYDLFTINQQSSMRLLDVGGAGADGANSSFRRKMLSMSTYAWINVKPFHLTSGITNCDM